jgi:hypothetical protein
MIGPSPLDALLRMVITVEGAGSRGDSAAATDAVRSVLDILDPQTAPPVPLLIDLVTLWARLVMPDDPVPTALVAWARYRVRATSQLYGGDDRESILARQNLATLLGQAGDHLEAAAEFGKLVAEWQAAGDGPETSGARASRARHLHAGGRCLAGIEGMAEVWRRWQTLRGNADRRSLRYGFALVSMLNACGRYGEAAARLAEIRPGPVSPDEPGRWVIVVAGLGTVDDSAHPLVCERQRDAPLAVRMQPAGNRVSWHDLVPWWQ